MEFIKQFFDLISDFIDLVFSNHKLVFVIVVIIFILLIYKIGVKVGSKKKPPEFKIKAKESYDLEDFIKK